MGSKLEKVLITGANRGLGLALSKEFLKKGFSVLASCRDKSKADELVRLSEENENLSIVELDVRDVALSGKLPSDLNEIEKLDLIVHNAGIHLEGSNGLNLISLSAMEETFMTNAFAPLFLTKALLPKLQESNHPKVCVISSQLGSQKVNQDHPEFISYHYCASKAALNSLFLTFSGEFPEVTTLLFHPGWVKTDMGGSNARLEASESASGLVKIMSEASLKDSGTFIEHNGNLMPW